MGDRDMPEIDQVHEEWRQLVRDWRDPWDEWNEVMDRITLAFANPPDEDFELANRLLDQINAAMARMKEFQRTLVLRSCDRGHL